MEDLPQLLTSMKIGAERIRNLVTSLRNFSRMDEAEVKGVNLDEGIESTLMILQNRLKGSKSNPAIQIVKNYGELPLVECYPGPLNQVLMNLIANAIDAVQERQEQETEVFQGRIMIEMQMLNSEWIEIIIADNGTGISEEVRSQMFNPFFTTKPPGKGTGFGLAISYSIIVERHQGRLECESELGHGSRFRIKIPLRQKVSYTSRAWDEVHRMVG